MNIFITNKDPERAALFLYKNDKRRAFKQIIECSQILSFVISSLYPAVNVPHKYQGNKTPAFWCMQSKHNFKWSYVFMRHLMGWHNKRITISNGQYKLYGLDETWNHIMFLLKKMNADILISDKKKMTPLCLCERSSIIKATNNCSVYQAYRQLLTEKWRDEKHGNGQE